MTRLRKLANHPAEGENMSDRPTRDTLELEVENFGPIVEAKIDLRPLTVFVGPSNTGKSYLAILIYALHRCFSSGPWFGFWRFSRESGMFQDGGRRQLPRKTIDALVLLARQGLADERKWLIDKSVVVPGAVATEIRSIFDAQGESLGNELGRSFGVSEPGTLIRKGKGNEARIVLRRFLSDDAAPDEHWMTVKSQETIFRTMIPEDTSLQIEPGWGGKSLDMLRRTSEQLVSAADQNDAGINWYAWQLIEVLTSCFAPRQVVGPLRQPAFYLPADRTGVMHTYKTVTSGLIESAPMSGARTAAPGPTLTGYLADFLQQLIALADSPPDGQGTAMRDIGTQIEDTILGGSVHVERMVLTGFPHFTYQPKDWKDRLPLMNASSMVSELGPVVLYLRHLVRPGDVLIVEEPESHLHPAMQVEFTRQLAALVRAGVRVIVTTHSEWILEELANVVRRSELCEARRKEIANGEVFLNPDQVGAWLFKPKRRPRGSVVEEMKPDDETGLYPTDYDPVSEALYNENVEIYNRIQDGSAG